MAARSYKRSMVDLIRYVIKTFLFDLLASVSAFCTLTKSLTRPEEDAGDKFLQIARS